MATSYRMCIDASIVISVPAETEEEAKKLAQEKFYEWSGGIKLGAEVFGDEADARVYPIDDAEITVEDVEDDEDEDEDEE